MNLRWTRRSPFCFWYLIVLLFSFLSSFILFFHLPFILRTKVFSFMPLIQTETLKSLDHADNILLVLSSCLLSDVPGLLEAGCKTSYSICSPWSFALLFPVIRVSYNYLCLVVSDLHKYPIVSYSIFISRLFYGRNPGTLLWQMLL